MTKSQHIGYQVLAMMDRLGVSPLTRNYHLFYTCIANSNPVMRRAVRSLGAHPTQNQIDQVIEEHCPEAVDSYMVRRHERTFLKAISELSASFRSEQSELNGLQDAMERVTSALAKAAQHDNVSPEMLSKVISAIGEAGNQRAVSTNRALERMDRNRSEVEALRQELVNARRMANTDALTELANRRHFDEKLASAMGQSNDFALILLDIDHFKRINDTHGHAVGDYILRGVAATIRQALRTGAFVARTGGEEFAIMLAKANEKDVLIVAERVRVAMEKATFHSGADDIPVTVSLGAALATYAETSAQFYENADTALYQSKAGGRNRVTLHVSKDKDASGNRYQIYR